MLNYILSPVAQKSEIVKLNIVNRTKSMNHKTIKEYVNELLNSYDFKNNSYFTNLINGDFSKEDFAETQIQMFHVTHFFPWPLSGLLAKMPDSPYRMNIVENLYEDHGQGFVDEYHENTFLYFLNNLDISKEEIKKRALWPESREFNMSLLGTSIFDVYGAALAIYGIVEAMSAQVAELIEQGVVSRGWLTPDKMQYYLTHERQDPQHAQDFFDAIEDKWNESEVSRYYIEQGLALGAHSFYNLYVQLYNSRKNRKFRNVEVPHIDLKGSENEL